MKLEIFSIFDSKMDAFLPPFFTLNKGMAQRSFKEAINQEGHQFSNHAEDYTLFHIGDFDQESAVINTLDTPKSLGLAIQFKNAEPVVDTTPTISRLKEAN